MILQYYGKDLTMIRTIFIIIICTLATFVLIYDLIQGSKNKSIREENKRLTDELRKLKEEQIHNNK